MKYTKVAQPVRIKHPRLAIAKTRPCFVAVPLRWRLYKFLAGVRRHFLEVLFCLSLSGML